MYFGKADRPLAQFKVKLTTVMLADFAGSWIVEVICKHLFADLEPKRLVTRGRERREARRAKEAEEKRIQEAQEEAEKQFAVASAIAELESRKTR